MVPLVLIHSSNLPVWEHTISLPPLAKYLMSLQNISILLSSFTTHRLSALCSSTRHCCFIPPFPISHFPHPVRGYVSIKRPSCSWAYTHNAMLMASNLKVVLGTAELGMRRLAKDQPVSLACRTVSLRH